MKTILPLIASLTILLFAFSLNAQVFSPKCVYEPDAQTQAISQKIIERMKFAQSKPSQKSVNVLTGVVEIPIVVHVITYV